MARYSVRTGRWYGRGRSYPPRPLPPGDDRQWRTELPGGLVRIDMGEPVKGLPSEPQPARIGGTAGAPKAPPPEPVSDTAEAERFAAMLPKDIRPRDWRDHRAITRNP